MAELHEAARQARSTLAEGKRQDAAFLKNLLEAERARAAEEEGWLFGLRKESREAIYSWNKLNTVPGPAYAAWGWPACRASVRGCVGEGERLCRVALSFDEAE